MYKRQELANDLEKSRLALIASKDEPASQQKLVMINRDLRYVAARLDSALITKPDLMAQQVLFGAKVTVENEEGTRLSLIHI